MNHHQFHNHAGTSRDIQPQQRSPEVQWIPVYNQYGQVVSYQSAQAAPICNQSFQPARNMAPKAASPALQRQGMPPAKQSSNYTNKQPVKQAPPQSQRPSNTSQPTAQNAAQAQAASRAPQQQSQAGSHAQAGPRPQQQQPSTPFSTLSSTTNIMLQQIGYVLSGPGRIEDRRDTFNTMYNELYSRFQQVADRLEDDICHAKQIVRGQYAVFLETQQQLEQQKVKKAEEEEALARKSAIEREAAEKKEAADRIKAEEEKRLMQDQNVDVIMVDSPSPPTQPPPPAAAATVATPLVVKKGVTPLPTVGQTGTPLAQANTKPQFEPPVFPQDDADGLENDGNLADDTELDFEALFGVPATTAPDGTTPAVDEVLPEPSADDLASLIPGIESYATMDQATPTATTNAPAPTALAGALDFMDFTMPDTQADAGKSAGDLGRGDDYLLFLNGDDQDENGQSMANDGDLDDWLNAMND